jgi:hypothetical protein
MGKFAQARKDALDESVGKRWYLYEETNVGIKHYHLGPMRHIPFQTYTAVLHEECGKAIYKLLKKQQKEARRAVQVIHRRYTPGFASRKRAR